MSAPVQGPRVGESLRRALDDVLPAVVAEVLARRDRRVVALWELEQCVQAGRVVMRAAQNVAKLEATADRLEDCGKHQIGAVRCGECKFEARPIFDECHEPLLCHACQVAEVIERRRLVETEIATVREKKGDYARDARMVTLPVPHEDQLEQRLTVAFRARHRWTLAMDAYIRSVRPGAEWWWWASLEVVRGDDDEGHVHWHLAELGEWLPQPLIAVEWGAALMSCGVETAAMWRPLGAVLEGLDQVAGNPRTRRAARDQIIGQARVPWAVPGERAPRREKGEPLIDYVHRRACWALELEQGERRARRRRLSGIVSRYGDSTEVDPTDNRLVDVIDVPWAVVDARRLSSVDELVKYTVKPEDETCAAYQRDAYDRFRVRVWASLRRRHRHERSQNVPDAAADDDDATACPECGACCWLLEHSDPPPRPWTNVAGAWVAEAADIANRTADGARAPPTAA